MNEWTDEGVAEWNRIRAKVDGISGRYVHNTPTSIAVGSDERTADVATPNPWPLFPVNLTQTGGSAGSSSAFCTFTYTVKDLAGNQLGTSVAVMIGRWVMAAFNAATFGLAYYDKTGTIKIAVCNETITQTNCS